MHESCPTGMLSYVKETNGDKDFFVVSLPRFACEAPMEHGDFIVRNY